MTESKNFLEFIRKNPPPCLPGDDLFWFCKETGEIHQDKEAIQGIALDNDWNWKLVEEKELITPNENPYFCLTFDAAKKFRTQISCFKYAIFKISKERHLICEASEKNYSYLKTKIFNVFDMKDEENFITAILRTDTEITPGMAITYNIDGENFSYFYFILEDKTYQKGFLTYTDKIGKRILEDIFD